MIAALGRGELSHGEEEGEEKRDEQDEEEERDCTCGACKAGHEGHPGITWCDILTLTETQSRLVFHTHTQTHTPGLGDMAYK